jgi:zinc protease
MRPTILNWIFIAVIITGSAFAQSTDSGRYLKEVLPNGLTAIIKHNPDTRVFAVDILGKNRAGWEQPGQEGITDFVNRMLIKGTKDKDAEQIQASLDDIGAIITTNDDPHIPYDDRYTWRAFSFVKFQTIDEFAQKGMDILYDIIANPTFPQEEIDQTKKQVMGILGMESASTSQVCRNLFYSNLLKDHPYAKPVLGTRSSVGNFTQNDLLLYHKRYYSPQNLVIAIVSDIETPTILKWVKKRFGKIGPYPSKSPQIQIPSKISGIVEQKQPMDKEQVYIFIGNITCGFKSADAPALTLAAAMLSSRLQLNLREKKGLAYSVGADAAFLGDFGWYVASIGTGYENFDTARAGIIAEIENLKTDMLEQAELDKARNSLWGSSLMRNMSGVNQAYNMTYYEFIGMPFNYDDNYLQSLQKVTLEDIKQVAQKYFDTHNYLLAYVGKTAQ